MFRNNRSHVRKHERMYFDKFICLLFFINMPFKSRVKSRVHTRDLKRLLIKNIQDKCVDYRYRFERGVDKKYKTNQFIRFERVDKKYNSSQIYKNPWSRFQITKLYVQYQCYIEKVKRSSGGKSIHISLSYNFYLISKKNQTILRWVRKFSHCGKMLT